MSLPVKKIYVDSLHRVSEESTSANFKIELPYSITMPHNAIFLIDEICIPHAWYSVEEGINDKMYLHVLNQSTGNRYNFRLKIPSGNYNGPLLQTALQTSFDVLAGSGWGGISFNYDSNTFSLRIDVNDANNKLWVLSDAEIANKLRGAWNVAVSGFGGNIDLTNPASMNDILRNYEIETKKYEQNTPFRSGFLNFQGINNLYLSSPNLGTFTTIGTRGEATIIKKIPVSSDFGYMIIDRSVSVHDYLECGKSTLKTLEFHLKDSKGRYVPMHGSNISFSIVFAIKAED